MGRHQRETHPHRALRGTPEARQAERRDHPAILVAAMTVTAGWLAVLLAALVTGGLLLSAVAAIGFLLVINLWIWRKERLSPAVRGGHGALGGGGGAGGWFGGGGGFGGGGFGDGGGGGGGGG